MKSIPSILNRRLTRSEFLRSLGRYVLLALVAVVAAWMAHKRRAAGGSGNAGKACAFDLPCRQCADLPGCGLVQAARTRTAIRSAKS